MRRGRPAGMKLAITILAVIAVIALALWLAIDGYGDAPSAAELSDSVPRGAATEFREPG